MLEAIVNKKVVKHLNKNKLLNNKQYSFRFSRSTVVVLTIESVKRLIKKISKMISLDISKVFYKVWHRKFLPKLTMESELSHLSSFSCQVCLWRSSWMSSPLGPIRPMLASPNQSSLLGSTLFLLYSNDLLLKTLSSFVNRCADDTTVYGCTCNYLDRQCLSADPFISLKSHSSIGKRLACIIQYILN